MEIEVPRGFVVTVVVVAVVGLLLFVGVASSPRDVTGRPLLLSPERRAILIFLRRAEGWEVELRRILADLDRLAEDIRIAPAPENLYDRARRAQSALDRARALEKEISRAVVPETIQGLHRLALEAAVRTREYAGSVSDRIGVPEGEIRGRAEAHEAVERFGSALREARGIP